MNSPPLTAFPRMAGDTPVSPLTSSRLSGPVARRLLSGTSTLGVGILIERGLGFLANVLAARFAGATQFGAYSLALTTANNISTYAAGGIGATATRFSGKYPSSSAGSRTLARVLIFVSLVSALLASLAIYFGAKPIAHLLHQPGLVHLLQWAAISAAGVILLECARGFFIGQRRLGALISLSIIVGLGMTCLLPIAAASHIPSRMIVSQGCVLIAAVIVSVSVASRMLGRTSQSQQPALPFRPMLSEVWTFGGIQLAGLIGSNLSGWWLTALVARSDSGLVQISFFAIASQLRNLAGIMPGLLTEGSYAVMADPSEEHLRTPHHVMALCTFACSSLALVIATIGIVFAPWMLARLYGSAYSGAVLSVAIGLAVAVIHMGNAPAAARLSIVSIRATGFINTLWALLVAGLATMLLLHRGSAALGMAIFAIAHLLSASLVLAVLAWKDHVPEGLWHLFLLTTGTVSILIALAYIRERTQAHPLGLSALLGVLLLLSAAAMLCLGNAHGWLPTRTAMGRLWQAVSLRLQALRDGGMVVGHGD